MLKDLPSVGTTQAQKLKLQPLPGRTPSSPPLPSMTPQPHSLCASLPPNALHRAGGDRERPPRVLRRAPRRSTWQLHRRCLALACPSHAVLLPSYPITPSSFTKPDG